MDDGVRRSSRVGDDLHNGRHILDHFSHDWRGRLLLEADHGGADEAHQHGGQVSHRRGWQSEVGADGGGRQRGADSRGPLDRVGLDEVQERVMPLFMRGGDRRGDRRMASELCEPKPTTNRHHKAATNRHQEQSDHEIPQ